MAILYTSTSVFTIDIMHEYVLVPLSILYTGTSAIVIFTIIELFVLVLLYIAFVLVLVYNNLNKSLTYYRNGGNHMKLYECIIDDGTNVFKTVTAAKNKKELLNVYGGNGTFEKIKDITKDTQHMGVDYLRESLRTTGWGEKEITLLTALLQQHLDSIK